MWQNAMYMPWQSASPTGHSAWLLTSCPAGDTYDQPQGRLTGVEAMPGGCLLLAENADQA